MRIPGDGFDLEEHLETTRQRFMLSAMDRCGGVQTRAAELLGMTFRSFRYFAKKYGITKGGVPGAEDFEPAEVGAGPRDAED